MWLSKEGKPIGLKRLLLEGYSLQNIQPEALRKSCPVTHGVDARKLRWLRTMESLAGRTDLSKEDFQRALRKILEQGLEG
jgi:hypothetical protein